MQCVLKVEEVANQYDCIMLFFVIRKPLQHNLMFIVYCPTQTLIIPC